MAPWHGLLADTPRAALRAGLQMGYIRLEDEATWLEMLKDRNLTSHVYQKQLADEIFERVVERYVPVFRDTLERVEKMAESQIPTYPAK